MTRMILAFLKKYRHFLLAVLIGLSALGKSLHHSFVENRSGSIIYMDSQGYYMYLPSVFIYNNFQDFPHRAADGSLVYFDETIKNKYTYPVALLQMPFFLVADLVAASDNSTPRDGRSWPYVLSILVAGAFYLGLGIFILSRLLSKWFRFSVVLITLLCIFLGTNLFYYSSFEPGVSHVYSFFLFALFWLSLDKFINHQRRWDFFMLGLIFGLIVVLRPTNIILAILFFTYRISSWKEMGQRVVLFFSNAYALPLFVIGIAIVSFPQMLYWNHAFGSWIVYSYGEEGFIYWNRPKIWQVLVDVQNGWLLYSPILVIALLGIGRLLKTQRFLGWGMIAILALATYIFASWWAWWFGGAFGHRSYVEYIALLSLPLALSIEKLTSWKPLWRVFSAVIIGFLLYYNLALTEIYSYTAPWDGPNWTWERFGEILTRIF